MVKLKKQMQAHSAKSIQSGTDIYKSAWHMADMI
jgi:hypothetical protein